MIPFTYYQLNPARIFSSGFSPISSAQSILHQNAPHRPPHPAIAFLFGIIVANLFFRQQISAIEGRALNDLECWKLECTNDIRKDSGT
jgi:hypothetical protein